MGKAATFLLALLLPLAAAGQAPPAPYAPGAAPGVPLSLEEAVRFALDHDPAVAQARAVKAFNLGLLQEQRGAFDEQFSFAASFSRETLPLPFGVKKNELSRRRLLRTVAIAFEGLANGIQQQLDSGVFGPLPGCVDTTLTIGTTVTEIHCIPPTVFIDLEAILRGSGDAGLDEAVEAVRQAWRRQLETYLATSRFIAYVGRQLLRQQGVAPTLEDRDTLSYSLGLGRLFRNGVFLEPKVELQAVRDTWRGKPLDPSFGGKGVLVSYRSQFGFNLDVPLGRGGGVVAAQAGERAASKQAEAAAYGEAAALQQAALRTTIAYYNAAAALARVRLLERTLARKQELSAVARALVEADELAPAELAQLDARRAQAASNLAAARQAWLRARVELATSMGLRAEAAAELPELAEELPPPPDEATLAQLEAAVRGEGATRRRPEVQAARAALQAASELAAGDRANLRREVTLAFTAFYSGLHESPRTMAITRWWPDASKAFGEGFVGPSVAVSLNFSLPVANSFARGRLQASLARQRQAAIGLGDLQRTVTLRAQELLLRLRQRQRELAERQRAVAAAQASLEAAQELFRAGEVSVVDLILTEETLQNAELALVDAQLGVAASVAQLRFELGELLPTRVTGTTVTVGEG